MADPLGHGGHEFLSAFAGPGKAHALRGPPGAAGVLQFAGGGDVQGVGLGAQTPQQADVWVSLDGIADPEALGERPAQGRAACRDILHEVDVARRPETPGDVHEGRVHRERTP
jgi:hypothetical protein